MKNDIVVKKLNETYCHITADEHIRQELADNFKFFIPSAKFQPSFKQKLWDGYIRLYNKNTSQMLVGLEEKIKTYAHSNDFSYHTEGFGATENISIEETEKYLETLNITSDGNPIKAYDYQLHGIQYALNNHRCILQSPTASGKSLIIYGIISYLKDKIFEKDEKILLIVPTINLVNQMYSDFKDYSTECPTFDSEYGCHKIMAGKEKISSSQIYISTWQSLIKLPSEYFNQFGCIIGDECIHPDSEITMFDGSKKKIKNLKIGEYIKSVNESTNKIENNKIIKIHKNLFHSKSEKRFKITTENGKELIVTGNHKIFTDNGWKEAKYLTILDKIKSYE